MELDLPLVLAMNMYDAVEKSGAKIRLDKAASMLGAPAVMTVGSREIGIEELINASLCVAEGREASLRGVKIPYGEEIESHIEEIRKEYKFEEIIGDSTPSRWAAVKLLENDYEFRDRLLKKGEDAKRIVDTAAEIRDHLYSLFKEDPSLIITEYRYGFVSGAIRGFYRPPAQSRANNSDLVDNIITHKVLGLPVFFLMIWGMFQLTFTAGAYPMEFLDMLVGRLANWTGSVLGDNIIRDLIVNGVIGGVGSVLVFLPNILILFFCISLIEDSGYMARAAFLMDRVMRMLGLHGKAFIPLLLGFGCNVPAIMATRTLETRRDRILTILINPLMSCSARLPVYVLLAGAFFPKENAGTLMFSIYLLGVVLAVVMARLFSKTILKSEASPFVMELPPYRMPTLKSSMIHMWDRAKMFLKKMGGIILIGSIVIWALTEFPRPAKILPPADSQNSATVETGILPPPNNGQGESPEISLNDPAISMEAQRLKNSYLGRLGRFMEPVIRPLGFEWKIGVALLSGVVAKEIVVSTLGVLYLGEEDEGGSENLQAALQKSELTPLRAYALMAFVLIYLPCLGTIAAIKRETNSWKWTAFSMGYSTALAWIVAFAIVNVGGLLGLG